MRLLHEPGAVQLAQREARHARGGRREDARVLALGDEGLDDAVVVAGRDDHVGLGGGDHARHRGLVDRDAGGDDAAERGAGVAVEGEAVGLVEGVGHRHPARVGVLDDGDGGLARRDLGQVVGQVPGGVGVEQVEVAERQARVLGDAVHPRRPPDLAVAGAALVRVLAVAELVDPFEGEVHGDRQCVGLVAVAGRGLVEPGDDGGVVGGGVGEGLAGQRAAGAVRERPGRAQLSPPPAS